MTEIHPDIERMINRALDGALDEDEQIALHRALLRDPEAHRLHDEYRALDERASAALRGALGNAAPSFDPLALTQPAAPARGLRYHRAWWLMPAAAAALLVFSLIGPKTAAPPHSPTVVSRTPATAPDGHRLVDGAAPPHPRIRIGNDSAFDGLNAHTVGYGTQSIKRVTDRDLLGVLGQDGRVYWLEVDRTRTLTKPKNSAVGKPVVGDL